MQTDPPLVTQYVQDGVLHLVRRRSDGYPNVTVSSEPCGQANPQSFRRGYFEARLRWTGVPGSGPALWLFSTIHATNPRSPQPACQRPTCLSAEIDVFEGYGNHLDVFTGTIHRNSCGCYGEPSRINSNNWQPQPGMNLSGWHVYAARWTSTDVTWYLDGRRIMSAPVLDSTDQPMHLLFYNWRTPWQAGNETSAATPDQLHTEVDWVRLAAVTLTVNGHSFSPTTAIGSPRRRRTGICSGRHADRPRSDARDEQRLYQRDRRGRDPVRCRVLGLGKHQSGRLVSLPTPARGHLHLRRKRKRFPNRDHRRRRQRGIADPPAMGPTTASRPATAPSRRTPTALIVPYL